MALSCVRLQYHNLTHSLGPAGPWGGGTSAGHLPRWQTQGAALRSNEGRAAPTSQLEGNGSPVPAPFSEQQDTAGWGRRHLCTSTTTQKAQEHAKSQASLLKYLGLTLPEGLEDQASPICRTEPRALPGLAPQGTGYDTRVCGCCRSL